MKKILLRMLFVLIPFLYSIYASSEPNKANDGSASGVSTNEIPVPKNNEPGSVCAFSILENKN